MMVKVCSLRLHEKKHNVIKIMEKKRKVRKFSVTLHRIINRYSYGKVFHILEKRVQFI